MPRPILAARWRAVAAALLAAALATGAARADEPAASAPTPTAVAAGAWIRSLAVQAATYAVPIVAMYNLRNTTSVGPNPKAPPGDIWRLETITTPEVAQQAGYVTPNVNVLYGFGFVDLSQQPVILSAPDSHGRYYMIEIVDMWTNAFAYVGGKTAGYQGGLYALVGPGWKGALPSGVKRIDCPTRWVEVQPRVHVKNAADAAAAQAVLNAITVTGLAQYTHGPVPAPVAYRYDVPRINPKVASSQMQFEDPLQFWEIFSAAMNENPPPESEIKSVLPQFGMLGIVLGKQWKREDVNPLVLAQMRQAAMDIGPMMNALASRPGHAVNGWGLPPPDTGMFGADYLTRAIIAVIGLTANTPAEAIYISALQDGRGQPLSGTKRYTMTFKPPMTYLQTVPPGFWSVTMYDGVTHLTVANPIGRYALGSDDDLTRNADGSFTLTVQHDDPGADKQANWLPAPAGPFYLILRDYAPVPDLVQSLRNPADVRAPPPVMPVE